MAVDEGTSDMKYNASVEKLFDTMPEAIKALPIDPRGYPVPWFVAQLDDGTWDFRAIRPGGVHRALTDHKCWICGRQLHDALAFVVGPMCTVNRVSAEPPSHLQCARFSVKACPFLNNPRMRRNEKDMPEEASDPGGIMIRRNPGVTAIWVTRRFRVDNHRLCHFGEPTRVEWWAQGRAATREEVMESIRTGMPFLEEACLQDPNPAESRAALNEYVAKAMKYIPEAANAA